MKTPETLMSPASKSEIDEVLRLAGELKNISQIILDYIEVAMYEIDTQEPSHRNSLEKIRIEEAEIIRVADLIKHFVSRVKNARNPISQTEVMELRVSIKALIKKYDPNNEIFNSSK